MFDLISKLTKIIQKIYTTFCDPNGVFLLTTKCIGVNFFLSTNAGIWVEKLADEFLRIITFISKKYRSNNLVVLSKIVKTVTVSEPDVRGV